MELARQLENSEILALEQEKIKNADASECETCTSSDSESNEIKNKIKKLEQKFNNIREDLYQVRMLKLELDELAFKRGRYEKFNKMATELTDQYLKRHTKVLKLREQKLQNITHKYLAEIAAATTDLRQEQEYEYETIYKDLKRQRKNLMWRRCYELRKLKKAKASESSMQ